MNTSDPLNMAAVCARAGGTDSYDWQLRLAGRWWSPTGGRRGRHRVSWAETTDDVAKVKDAAAKWSAITEYVRQTSRGGVAEAEGTLRRLEIRVGTLLGPATRSHDRTAGAKSVATNIDRVARHDLRKLADHADVVEDVIATSDDANPPSRRKSLSEIERRKRAAEDAEFVEQVVVDAVARRTPAPGGAGVRRLDLSVDRSGLVLARCASRRVRETCVLGGRALARAGVDIVGLSTALLAEVGEAG